MARSFNPPPNWPRPPQDWTPPEGWQPDPSWGPAPQGWNFWVDAGAPGPDTPADAPFAAPPEQDPGTSSPFATPGAAAGDATSPFAQPAPTGRGSFAPGGPDGHTSPFASSSSAPYSGAYSPNAGAHPGAGTPWYKKPLTWILAAAAALIAVIALAFALGGDGDDAAPGAAATATDDGSGTGTDPEDGDTAGPGASATEDATAAPDIEPLSENRPFGPGDEGSDPANPLPYGSTTSITDADSGAVYTYLVGEPQYLADEAVAAVAEQRPAAEGTHFALLPVEVTYQGPDSVSAWSHTSIAYVAANGTTIVQESQDILAPDDLWEAPDVSDGQTATGNMVVEIPAGMEATGAWVITGGLDGEQVYFGAPPAEAQ